MKIKIVDLGVSNINSIHKCISFLGFDSEVVQTPNKLIDADKIIERLEEKALWSRYGL